MKRFENKVVLITGAASGIGFVTAQEFATEGAQVIATDINTEALEKAFKDDIANGLKIETRHQDVTVKLGGMIWSTSLWPIMVSWT